MDPASSGFHISPPGNHDRFTRTASCQTSGVSQSVWDKKRSREQETTTNRE
jgi:hypothetical protein